MTLFDIAYRCCMLDKYGICNDVARNGVSVADFFLCPALETRRMNIFLHNLSNSAIS